MEFKIYFSFYLSKRFNRRLKHSCLRECSFFVYGLSEKNNLGSDSMAINVAVNLKKKITRIFLFHLQESKDWNEDGILKVCIDELKSRSVFSNLTLPGLYLGKTLLLLRE